MPLEITVPASEVFDQATEEFISTKEQTLKLEHSLVSLSKWEAKHGKPFLTKEPKSVEEHIDYIRCMTLTQNVDPNVYLVISPQLQEEVAAYIDMPMTATTFSKQEKRSVNREIVTAEIIYYWMISHNIPFECQKWHLNRLLTLINVCDSKAKPPRRMSKSEVMRQNKALNEARKRKYHTRG